MNIVYSGCLTQAWLTVFSSFCYIKFVFLSKLGKPLRYSVSCIYIPTFFLNSAKCWFRSLGDQCKIPREIAHICTVCNVQNLQCDLMSKINILRSWDRKCVRIHRLVLLKLHSHIRDLFKTCSRPRVLLRSALGLEEYANLEVCQVWESKHDFLWQKRGKNGQPSLGQTDYSTLTIIGYHSSRCIIIKHCEGRCMMRGMTPKTAK